MGVDRALGGNLRLGAFVGAGASREAVELNVQTIDATYVFGGAYGRFDWISQYLDFSLYGRRHQQQEHAPDRQQHGCERAGERDRKLRRLVHQPGDHLRGEATAMSDKSDSFAASGGAQVSF